ncbi:flagellar hook assembly protein FlgD [Idiomarina seosinensis]|uniref:flagellar hook assembly protein FlgD n=1 Tax=Idiomarina seosinensis TaxID=281739 RepID=UPI00384C1EF2
MENVSNNSYIDGMRWKREEGAQFKDPSEKQKLEQEDFFKLLTEQLNMQDPTKPVDNDQMISQMTNFSMAEGISQMSDQFTQFTQNMTSNQALQASTMVGRNVMVPTNQAYVDPGESASGAIVLDQSGYDTKITIKDKVGQVVDVVSLGDMQQGLHDFEWDGIGSNGEPVPAGAYTMTAQSTIGGERTEVPLQMRAKVQSVSMGSGEGVVLNLKGLGGIKFSEVSEIS